MQETVGKRVVAVDDERAWRMLVRTALEGRHTIVAESESLNDALAYIDGLDPAKPEFDVCVFDGDLGANTAYDCDIEAVIHRMRKRGIVARIIGYSSVSFRYCRIPCDFDLIKLPSENVWRLPDVIDEVCARETPPAITLPWPSHPQERERS